MTWQNLVIAPEPGTETYRKPSQARGIEKFERILDAGHHLIEQRGIGQFGIRDVASFANVASGSVYHFFPNIELLYVALVERYDKEFENIVSRPLDAGMINTWTDVVTLHFENARNYINSNKPALTMMIGPGRSWQLRQADTVADADIAVAIENSLSEFFILPASPPPTELLHIGIRILEGLWELSVQQHGYVTPAFSEETTRAVVAYFGMYWPPYLERKQQ